MLDLGDLAVGVVFKYRAAPYVVLRAEHVQMGRGGAILRTKIKNLITNQVFDITYKAGDKLEEADLDRRSATFLYHDAEGFHFMDTQSYEQFFLTERNVGEQARFLSESSDFEIIYFEQKPAALQLPKKVKLTVVETAPGVRGDTAQGSVTKPAKLNSGATVNVPLFVKQGDVVIVNTDTGQYVERA